MSARSFLHCSTPYSCCILFPHTSSLNEYNMMNLSRTKLNLAGNGKPVNNHLGFDLTETASLRTKRGSIVSCMPLLATAVLAAAAQGTAMDCGATAVCGVLTLESGFGPGVYGHPFVAVHGLWPEVGAYGSSQCAAPTESTSIPTKVYPCYVAGGTPTAQLGFEQHEWSKHGMCSGVKDADDFFSQICALSAPPLKVMAAHNDTTLSDMAAAVTNAGYEIFSIDTVDSQLQLSACLKVETGTWILAPVADFASKCGTTPVPPGPAPTPPAPTPPATSCERGVHGPRCTKDEQCTSVPKCIRCAKSGYCTDQPMGEDMALNFTAMAY